MQGLRAIKALDCWQRHGAHQAALDDVVSGLYFLSQSKSGISALALKRHLGVSYPTAWLLRHKLMQVMFEREQASVLSGASRLMTPSGRGVKAGRQGRGVTRCPSWRRWRPI